MLIADLRVARREKGWTQKELADRIGTSAPAITRLEKGVGSAKTLQAAMDALQFRLTGIGPGETLSEQLRGRRMKRSLSLDRLAQRTGLSRTTLLNLERGGGSVASLMKALKILAPNAKRRAPERAYWGKGDKEDRDSRFTPPDFMANIYQSFGAIDLDPCAHLLSPVIAGHRIILAEDGDGLNDEWSGKTAFVNPPFSQLLKWLRRAHDQWRIGNVETVICLVPVRTDSPWFHETLSGDADIYLLQGRVRFLAPSGGHCSGCCSSVSGGQATVRSRPIYSACCKPLRRPPCSWKPCALPILQRTSSRLEGIGGMLGAASGAKKWRRKSWLLNAAGSGPRGFHCSAPKR